MCGNMIKTELLDGILTIRFNRPEKRNALTQQMYRLIAEAIARGEEDDAVRVLLLTGGDSCFTAGNDLSDFPTPPPLGTYPDLASEGITPQPPQPEPPAIRFLMALGGAKKPVVAAVNGSAVGVGVTMLLHCDLVYAGEGANFQMPFVRLGLCPEAGSTLLLPLMMGHRKAAGLLLLGEPFTSQKAEELGIVTEVMADAEVQATARERALKLAALPPDALRVTKNLLKRGVAAQLESCIGTEWECFMERLRSNEANEALKRFRVRKEPC